MFSRVGLLVICFVVALGVHPGMQQAHSATLRLAYDAGFGGAESLDPYSPTRFFFTTSTMYSRLVRREQDGSAGPDLATSWDVSVDAKIWTFYLREGVKFHSGKPLSAADVAYSCLLYTSPSPRDS